MREFGRKLNMIRALNDVSQAEMGRRLGHGGNGYVRQVLKGDKPVPIGDLEAWLDSVGKMTKEQRHMLRQLAIKESDNALIKEIDQKLLEAITLLEGVIGLTQKQGLEVPKDFFERLDALKQS